uniref:Uncharacterized protein n=2 Tax=Setaria TaxID=4554 RepID=K3YKJ5_SETIT
MPNRLLKIACEEAIAKRQFRWHKAIRIIVISISQQGPGLSSNYSLSTSNPPTSTNLSLGPWQAYHTSRLKYQITWCGQHWLLL